METHLESPSGGPQATSKLDREVRISRRRSSRSQVLIVICAYNEARALPDLLETLGRTDVLVVDDGSSDETGRLAERQGAIVLKHGKRMGKAASLQDAIDYALDNGYGVVLEMGADAVPDEGAVESLIRALDSSAVGGASVRQIPLGPEGVSYHIDELIWSVLAHGKTLQMASHGTSHLGGVMYAFKPECVSSVEGSVNDDEHLSVCIRRKGYRAVFVADSLVYFDASSSIGHILERRKRMYFGHLVYPESTAPSMEIRIAAPALLRSLTERPSRLPWMLPALLLDFVSRLGAWRDNRNPKKRGEYAMWVTTFEKNMVSGVVRGNR